MFQMTGKTHPGAVREHNEDAFYCDEENGFCVVADGMGGYAAGEVASEIIVKTLEELRPGADKLVAALVECHARITAHAEAHPDSKGMGAAVVSAKLDHKQLSVCWAGDSRAYLFNKETGLKPVSRDHSYVQWLLTQGQITEEQAREHPDRNLVTQCLGLQPPQPELTTVGWHPGDTLLLCSDGLTDELDDEAIAERLHQADSAEAAVDQLVEAALAVKGKDNITVVLAKNPAPAEAEPLPAQAARDSGEEDPRSKERDARDSSTKDTGAAQSPVLPIILGVGMAILILIAGLLFLGLD